MARSINRRVNPIRAFERDARGNHSLGWTDSNGHSEPLYFGTDWTEDDMHPNAREFMANGGEPIEG